MAHEKYRALANEAINEGKQASAAGLDRERAVSLRIHGLGSRRKWHVVEALEASEDEATLEWLVYILGQWKGPKVIATLERLAFHKNPEIALKARWELGLQGPPALAFFRGVLKDPATSAQARDLAVDYLGDAFEMHRRHRDFPTVVSLIVKELDHPEPNIRWTAAFALAKLRSRTALPALRRHANDGAKSEYGKVSTMVRDAITYLDSGVRSDDFGLYGR